jgi:hypothetical protein
MSTTQEEARETGTFSTGIYGGVHPLLNFAVRFDLANHMEMLTNLLEVLHLSKFMADSTQI